MKVGFNLLGSSPSFGRIAPEVATARKEVPRTQMPRYMSPTASAPPSFNQLVDQMASLQQQAGSVQPGDEAKENAARQYALGLVMANSLLKAAKEGKTGPFTGLTYDEMARTLEQTKRIDVNPGSPVADALVLGDFLTKRF